MQQLRSFLTAELSIKKAGDCMIFVTKMNNETILLNNDLIETIEETPDTVVTLTTGKKLIIKESSKEVLKRVIDFKMKIYNGDYDYGK